MIPAAEGDVLLQKPEAQLSFVGFFACLDSVHVDAHDVFGQGLETKSALISRALASKFANLIPYRDARCARLSR